MGLVLPLSKPLANGIPRFCPWQVLVFAPLPLFDTAKKTENRAIFAQKWVIIIVREFLLPYDLPNLPDPLSDGFPGIYPLIIR